MSDPTEDDIDDFARRQELRRLTHPDRVAHAGVPALLVMAHVKRRDGPVDLAMERRIRADPDAWALYRQMLDGAAEGASHGVRAASEETVLQRDIGPHRLRIRRDGATEFIIISLRDGAGQGDMFELEAREAGGNGLRVRIGQPVAGEIALPVSERFTDLVEIARIIRLPDSSVWLLRVPGAQG